MVEALVICILGFLWYQFIAVFGISIGLHRHFAHRQFNISKSYEVIVLFLITLTGARSPLGWIGAHRMHHAYADTTNDPHSPDIEGFWKIFFNQWTCQNISRKYIKDVVVNPRIIFFHRYWKYIHLSAAVVTLVVGLDFFIILIVFPYILGFVGYGFFNAGGHKNYAPRTNFWINILSAGEGFHDIHHKNEKLTRLNRYDISGIVIERLIK